MIRRLAVGLLILTTLGSCASHPTKASPDKGLTKFEHGVVFVSQPIPLADKTLEETKFPTRRYLIRCEDDRIAGASVTSMPEGDWFGCHNEEFLVGEVRSIDNEIVVALPFWDAELTHSVEYLPGRFRLIPDVKEMQGRSTFDLIMQPHQAQD